MGDVADDCREGVRCQECARYMPDLLAVPDGGRFDAPGFPRTCPDCEQDDSDEEAADSPVPPRASRRSRRRRKTQPP